MRNKQTQNRAILAALRNGSVLTPLMALRRFSTLKLATRIGECAKILAAHQQTHYIAKKRVRTNSGKWVMSYFLARAK